jgi:hypothetical protein
MTGGIVQLVAYGKEDLFLTRDPQITFFKVIYRRHTNFAKEEIEQHFIHEPNFGKRTTCIVSPDGDLIDRMTLRITLPALSGHTISRPGSGALDVQDSGSGSLASIPGANSFGKSRRPENGSPGQTGTKFAWIRRIGYALIKYIEIEINGTVIDRHYGEWMHIWSTLTTRNITDGGLDKLIGNVPELTDFSENKSEYVLYIPLQFWFCRASGLAIPVISLNLSLIKINIELFEIEKCIITSPTHYIKCDANLVNFEPYEYLVQKGLDGIERYGIFSNYDVINKRLYYTAITCDNFIGVPYDGDTLFLDPGIKFAMLRTPKSEKYSIHGISSEFSIKPDLAVNSIKTHRKSLKNIKLKECILLVDYVYLDDDERFKFARTKHDYLIEQLYFTPSVAIDSTNPGIKLDIDQPCKLTVWLAQLDYISNFNDRFNYTDSHILKRPYDTGYTDPTKIKLYDGVSVGQEIGNSLFEEEAIRLNSQIRLSKRNNDYYEYLQPVQHSDNRLPGGCGMYSYALLPTDVLPSGTTNMSQIELIELNLKMNHRINANHRAKARSYSLCYTVWRAGNGLSSPIFVR